MENRWREQRGGDQWIEVSRRKSQSKRPPRGPQGCWQQTVPSWEKSFCKIVGTLDWETVLEMKRFSFLFNNVAKWDSSACEEAFQNAKNRFWAQLHGIPCDVSLPDPDLYIDQVDWDCKVDSDLVLDLDCKPVDPGPDEKHDPVIIFGDALIPNDVYFTPGWGEEEKLGKAANSSSLNNHEDQCEHLWKNNETTKQSRWNGEWGLEENEGVVGCTGWGDDWNNNSGDWSRDHHHKEDFQNLEGRWGADSGDYQKQVFENSKGRNWHSRDNGWANGGNVHYESFSGTRDGSYRRGNRGRYMSKNKFPSDRNGKGQKESVPWERATSNRRDGWGKAGQAWSWKKPVM